MIYTVTCNPSLDYLMQVKDFTAGTVNRTVGEQILPGGKGINVSMVLNNLGIKNKALGFTAGFTGNEIGRLLSEKGIQTDFLWLPQGNSRINVKLFSGEDTEINGRGPLVGREDVEKLCRKLDELTEGDGLVLAGSIPEGLPDSLYAEILHRLRTKRLRVVVDATKKLLEHTLEYHPFLIKPNLSELEEFFDVRCKDRQEIIRYAKKLQDKGAANVLVSMAGDGALLLTEEGRGYAMAAPAGKAVSAVGAGDSMVAGFLAGYYATEDYQKALAYGVCTGSASAFSEHLADREAVEKLLSQAPGIFEQDI